MIVAMQNKQASIL